MPEQVIRFGRFSFTPKPHGVEVACDRSAVQTEIIGTWPWSLFEQIVAAKPTQEK